MTNEREQMSRPGPNALVTVRVDVLVDHTEVIAVGEWLRVLWITTAEHGDVATVRRVSDNRTFTDVPRGLLIWVR